MPRWLVDPVKRGAAMFVAGATAVPLTAQIVDIPVLKAAYAAGVVAVWNLAGRAAQAWLKRNPEDV